MPKGRRGGGHRSKAHGGHRAGGLHHHAHAGGGIHHHTHAGAVHRFTHHGGVRRSGFHTTRTPLTAAGRRCMAAWVTLMGCGMIAFAVMSVSRVSAPRYFIAGPTIGAVVCFGTALRLCLQRDQVGAADAATAVTMPGVTPAVVVELGSADAIAPGGASSSPPPPAYDGSYYSGNGVAAPVWAGAYGGAYKAQEAPHQPYMYGQSHAPVEGAGYVLGQPMEVTAPSAPSLDDGLGRHV